MAGPYWSAQWNITSGCSHASPGCDRCWAHAMHERFHPGVAFEPTLHASRMDQPARWRKPRVVFVCNTGDLFHADVPDGYIRSVFQAMADTPRHTFLLLTKRAERMSRWTYRWGPNVWAGVTAEDQQRADERIPLLLATPAAHRWVSVEPMLEAVRLDGFLGGKESHGPFLDQVVAGCESGPGMRQSEQEWFAQIVEACGKWGVGCFIKQIHQGQRLSKDPLNWPAHLVSRYLAWRQP